MSSDIEFLHGRCVVPLEGGLGELGVWLTKRSVLEQEHLQTLAAMGIDTPEELLALACDPERRSWVARQLDLSEDDLMAAGVLAKFLTVQGPGTVMARQVLSVIDLAEWADPEDRESTQAILELAPGDFVEMLAEIAEGAVKQHAEDEQRRSNRNEVRLWLAFIVLTPIALFLTQWNRFFRPTRGDAVLTVVREFYRAGVYLDVAAALAAMVGLIAIGKLLSIISSNLLPTERLYDKYLTWRDRLIAAEAFALLPPRLVKIFEWFQANLTLASLVMVAIVVVVGVSRGRELTDNWAGYIVLANFALFVLLMFWLQAQAFARFDQQTGLASPTRERFAELQALRFPLAMGVAALVLYFAFLPAYRIGLGALSTWHERQQTLRMSAFEGSLGELQLAAEQQAEWTTVRAEWVAWGQQQVDTSLTSMQIAYNGVLTAFDVFRRTLAIGLLGVLLAVALAEYLYASRPKGAASLAIWVAALLASEFLPDRIARALGISEAAAVGVILTLALAAFISVVGELGIAWRGRQQEHVCPNPECFAVLAGEAKFCQHCGTEL